MDKYVIITDTTSDLRKEYQEKYDIKVINGHIICPDKTEIPAFLEWKDWDRDQFYTDLKKNPDGWTTAPPNVQEYIMAYESYIKEGYGILAITISGGISGSYGFMTDARKQLLKDYPDAKIECIDSRKFGPCIGLLCVYAAMNRDKGMNLKENAEEIEKLKMSMHQAGWLDDLSFVAKKGRISHPKAFFGTLAGVKPLGDFDDNGLTTVIGKVKGAATAYKVLLDYMEKTIKNPEDQIIFIAQTSREKQALQFKEMIVERFHPKEIYVNDVFPVCGINIGPGLMAAYYVGKPLSRELTYEKQLMDSIINGEK